MTETAISIDHVYKDFVLPHERKSSVKSVVTSVFKGATQHTKETQHALKNISFDVKKGEFFGIVGRNGSGKSTLLKIIAGIYQPTKGTVRVEGRLVPFIELGVGFNPELTGRENVYLNGALLGFDQHEVEAMYDDIVQFAELERFMDQRLKNYSSGMQVRLAFSMAVRARADILLIDEVLAVGDADFQRKCFDYFKKLKRDKKTVIFVSHDMDAVKEYCDRAVLIEDNKLERMGDPADIAAEYRHMFTEVAEEEVVEASPAEQGLKRWGDGKVRYVGAEVSPGRVTTEKTIAISLRAQVNEDVEKPIFGFSIKGPAGEYLLGTNTRINGLEAHDVRRGEEYEVTWKVPNIFANGQHFVNASVEHDDGITECDWQEDATTFTVEKQQQTPYPVQPDLAVEVRKVI